MRKPGKSKQKQAALTDAEQRIASLEKQLQWEKMRADALEKMIKIAEKELHIQIRKKPGAEPRVK